MTEFEYWKLAVSRYETDASYTDWLEGRSERLRALESRSEPSEAEVRQ